MRRSPSRARWRRVPGLAGMAMASAAVFTFMAPATAANAAASDTFALPTASNCPENNYIDAEGFIQFQDYGDGAPGGGKNDDYLIVGDSCPNNDGVKAWAWVNGVLKGSMYNGNGAYTNKIWDPLGNLADGASLGVKICSVNGSGGTPYHCNSTTRTIHE